MNDNESEDYKRKVLALACCIRRAWDLPPGPVIRPHVYKEHPQNDHYWHTREACHTLARKLGIFFPDVIGHFQHVTCDMHSYKVREASSQFWFDVVHPNILVQEVMES